MLFILKERIIPIVFFAYNIFLLAVIYLFVGEPSIILIGLIGLITLLLCAKGIDDRTYRKLFITVLIAYSFMIFMYFGLIQKNGIPYQGGDDELFEEYGNYIYNRGVRFFKDIPYIQGGWYAKGYYLIIAWIKRVSLWIGDYSTFSPRILNIYLWQAISVLMYKRLPGEIDDRLKTRAFVVLATFPNALVISSFVYRDVCVCFFVVIAVISFETIIDENKRLARGIAKTVASIICCGVSLYFLYYLRMQICFVVLVILILKFFTGRSGLANISRKKKIFFTILAFLVIVPVLYYTGGIKLLNLITDTYTSYRLEGTGGLSSKIFSVNLLPFGIILRFIYGLATPFPGGLLVMDFSGEFIYSVLYTIVYLGTVFQLFLVPYLLKHVIRIDYAGLVFLAIFFSVIITTFTFRHFVMVYPFMMEPIVVEYNNASTATKNHYRYITAGMLVMLAVLYLVVR